MNKANFSSAWCCAKSTDKHPTMPSQKGAKSEAAVAAAAARRNVAGALRVGLLEKTAGGSTPTLLPSQRAFVVLFQRGFHVAGALSQGALLGATWNMPVLRRCSGSDIIRKGSKRRGKYLFSLPCVLARTVKAAGQLGTVSKLNTKHPIMTICMPNVCTFDAAPWVDPPLAVVSHMSAPLPTGTVPFDRDCRLDFPSVCHDALWRRPEEPR